MPNIEAIIVDGVRYDKVEAKTEFVCEECELREVCEENGDFAIACGDALSSDNEYWKERNNNMNSYKTKNGVDVWVTRTYDCEPNLGGFYCQIYLDKDLERELEDFVIPAEVVNDDKEEEYILEFISNYWAEVVYEMCFHCGNEVVLYAEKKPQRCPDCGKWIAPCALCEDCKGHCTIA